MNNPVDKINRIKVWVLLGSFILPIVGLIAYFVYRKDNEKTAILSLISSFVGLTIVIIYKYIM